jgi:O-antigen ligase
VTYGRILRLVALLGVLAAAYGLSQTFGGFPAWDKAWIRDQGYAALSVGGVTRAFGSFSSASEYASFVAIALLVWIVRDVRLPRMWFAVPIVAVLGTALVYESSRGIMFKLPVALVLILAARARQPMASSLVTAAAAIVLLPVVVSSLVPAPSGGGASSPLIQHQLSGLANPLNRSSSTLAVHASLVGEGLRTALHDPLGLGTGAVTIAGQKFGGASLNTEADPSNAAVALGIPGLLAYVVLLYAAFGRAYSLAVRRRDTLSLVALGVLVVTLLEWLNGGEYAVAFLLWLTLGWIDRASRDANGVARRPA